MIRAHLLFLMHSFLFCVSVDFLLRVGGQPVTNTLNNCDLCVPTLGQSVGWVAGLWQLVCRKCWHPCGRESTWQQVVECR